MLVSIITVCYNAGNTLEHTIQSVLEQDYRNIEYIVVDGASTDNTGSILDRYRDNIDTLISEPDGGIYDAMNKGIRAATGDVVGMLNADDFYVNKEVISTIVDAFNTHNVDSVFADLYFVRPENLQQPIRRYRSMNLHPDRFAYGWQPAHPTFFVKRRFFDVLGYYNTDYRIAGDFDLLIRFLCHGKVSYHYIPAVLVIMRIGGISNRSFRTQWISNREVFRACKENNIDTSFFKLYSRYFKKIPEYFRK